MFPIPRTKHTSSYFRSVKGAIKPKNTRSPTKKRYFLFANYDHTSFYLAPAVNANTDNRGDRSLTLEARGILEQSLQYEIEFYQIVKSRLLKQHAELRRNAK